MRYQSDVEVIRNLSQITGRFAVIDDAGGWRIVRFERVVQGSEIWVVNPKGFLWEPFDSPQSAARYLAKGEFA